MPQINVTVDASTKLLMEKFCDHVGISVSAAINLYIKKVINEQRIPFEISSFDPYFEDEKNLARIKESLHQLKTKGAIVHELYESEND